MHGISRTGISEATPRASAGKQTTTALRKKPRHRRGFFLNDFFMIGEIFSGNFSAVPVLFS